MSRPVAREPSRLIEVYEEIARASRTMLDAAKADDWERVARIEAECRDLIDRIRTAAEEERLDAGEARRRMEILRGVLQDDAQIRARSEPWLQDLNRILGVS